MAGVFTLTPGTLTLKDLRGLLDQPRPIALDPASHRAIDRSAAVVQAVIDRGETAYGINTGFGALARTHIKDDQLTELQRRLVLSHAAGTGEPLSDLHRARRPDPQDQRPGARLLRHPPQRDRGAGRAAECRGLSAHPGQGLGRRLRRPGAARAYVGDPARHRRGQPQGQGPLRRRRPEDRRPEADRPRRQGRARPAQRHPGLDRAGGHRPVRRRRSAARRPDRRRDVDRCGARQRRAVRSAHPRGARPARPDRRRARADGADGRQRPARQPHRLRPGAGSLFAALPAAGDGRGARPAAPCRQHHRARVQRGQRQSAGVRRPGRHRLRRQLPCRAGGAGRRRHRHWRSRRSARSPNGAPPC